MRSTPVALWLTIGLAAGCGDNGSSEPVDVSVATNKLIAQFSIDVMSDTHLVDIAARFFDADAPDELVRLDPDDSLSATLRGQTALIPEIVPRVARRDGVGSKEYGAFMSLGTPITTGEELVFQLVRSTRASAMVTVTLPGFAIDPVASPASRASDLVITWSPPDDNAMSWFVSGGNGSLLDSGDVAVPGDGMLTLPANSLVAAHSNDVTAAGIELTRNEQLPVGAAFADGHLEISIASPPTSFTSTP